MLFVCVVSLNAPFLLIVILFFCDICDMLIVFTFLFEKRKIVLKNVSFHPVKLTVDVFIATGVFAVTIAICVVFWVVIFHPIIQMQLINSPTLTRCAK